MSVRAKPPRSNASADADAPWSFRLFVVERSASHSERAIADLRYALDHHLAGRYHLEIIDLRERPELAVEEQLIVIPAVIRKRPEPQVRLTGSFADEERVAQAFDLPPVSRGRPKPGGGPDG